MNYLKQGPGYKVGINSVCANDMTLLDTVQTIMIIVPLPYSDSQEFMKKRWVQGVLCFIPCHFAMTSKFNPF